MTLAACYVVSVFCFTIALMVFEIKEQRGCLNLALTTKMREYRARHNLTQERACSAYRRSEGDHYQFEKGRYNPSLKLAMDIAKVFFLYSGKNCFFFFTEEGKN
jgi:DNA-binding XRE family transcriptional regulator